jgi:SWI/SNF-related matrix-associated actin-dependent regulator 1 of chromatin subfamily A
MLVTYAEDISCFIAFSAYDERNIPKEAGWRWDPSTKRWFTMDVEKARRLERFADASARAKLAIVNGVAQDAIAASKASDAAIDVPTPPGLSLLPYQRAGVAYALRRRDTLIGDEMGLGKTIQAIGVANCLGHVFINGSGTHVPVQRVLVVCPASLRLNWKREWARWHTGRLRPVVVTDSWPLALRGNDLLAEPIAAIFSYEGVLKWKLELDKVAWDLAIFDEAHALKNPSAKRTKAVFGVLRGAEKQPALKASRRVFLTGTPIVNRPEELWPLVHSIDPEGLGKDRNDYRIRYVLPPLIPNPPRHLQYAEAARWYNEEKRKTERYRMAELHDRLRSSFMVRRLKADVLTELPAKRRQVILLDPEGMQDALAEEKAVLDKARQDAQERRKELLKLQAAGDTLGHKEAIKRLHVWRGAALSEISRIRHQTAVRKLPAVIEHLWAALDETEKVVVFGHHHDVIDGLAAEFGPACVVFDGRMNDQEKSDAVAKFQSTAGVRLFVGSLRAAGLGITLTAASLVTFAELDWTPAAMVQAEDRLHRIGQRDAVLVQHLVVDGSIDQRMATLLIQKAEMIGQILDGVVPDEARESILDDLIKKA